MLRLRAHHRPVGPLADASAAETRAHLRAESRRLRNGLIGLAVFCGLVAALLVGVPGLRSAAERMSDADPTWVGVAVAFELLSCASYVILFELVFAKLRRRLASRLSLSELAMNSVVSAGGIGGFALGAWVLRSGGAPMRRIAERSVVMFLLTSLVNVGAVVVCGVLMGAGVLAGSTDPLLTLLPAGAAVVGVAATLGLAAWAERAERRRPLPHGRAIVALGALAEGVRGTVATLRRPDWRLGGAVGYWLFDNAVLWASMYAYGHEPAVGAVVLAYLIGMLANSLPIPGGFGAVEGGLVGMLLLYGERPASAVVAAVITYRAISLWVPSVIGTIAFWGVRGELGEPLARAVQGGATGS